MNKIEKKINSLYRYALWNYFSKPLDLIHVAEYPKSGGSWLTQLLSEYLKIENRRNKIPKFEKAILHGHYKYKTSYNKTIFIVRDVRDVMVSYYHMLIIGNKRRPESLNQTFRDKMGIKDHQNVKDNLPKFIDYVNTTYTQGFNKFTWSNFIDFYTDKPDVHIVKYEDMLVDAKKELTKILNFLDEEVDHKRIEEVVDKFSFQNQTNRKPGEEDKTSFIRKGIAGDWKNYFNEESCKKVIEYSGKELIKMGYENDNSWIDQIK